MKKPSRSAAGRQAGAVEPQAAESARPVLALAPASAGSRRRRTPCIGVCSTTYGDLVCRGCNRFAHEVVGWNAYEERQREVIWRRLDELRRASVRAHLRVVDETLLRHRASGWLHDADSAAIEDIAYHALRTRPQPLVDLGLDAYDVPPARGTDPKDQARAVLRCIDHEFYTRSRAIYEASFKTLT